MPQPSRNPSSPVPEHAETAPIANPVECEWLDRLWLLSFGSNLSLLVYAWADSLQDAFEAAVEHLDDTGNCGVFTHLTEDDYRQAAEELGLEWDPASPDHSVMEHAEVDLEAIGWTTLDCARAGGGSAFIPSWEWTGREVHGGERECVHERSLDELEDDELEDDA